MTRDEIIALAHKLDVLDAQHYGTLWVDKLVRIAEEVDRAVRADEREACAKVCEEEKEWDIAEAIRARGDK